VYEELVRSFYFCSKWVFVVIDAINILKGSRNLKGGVGRSRYLVVEF